MDCKTKYKAPEWLAEFGLEWIVRLIQEPKRLLRRYLVDNFLFIIYFVKTIFKKLNVSIIKINKQTRKRI